MLKKNFGKILFFLANIFLLAGGVLFVKNREDKKASENAGISDIQSNADNANMIETSNLVPSSILPVVEEKTTAANSTAPYIKPNTSPTAVSATAPASSSTAKKAKTKTS
jgi:hypothetical protein